MPCRTGVYTRKMECIHHEASRSIHSIFGWAGEVRTHECGSQSPVPYHLATAHYEKAGSLKQSEPAVGWLEGFEPSASRATIWRANQLRHTHHILFSAGAYLCTISVEDGTPGGTRTPDLLLRRQLLYPAELLAYAALPCETRCPGLALEIPAEGPVHLSNKQRAVCSKDGAGDGNRTHATSLEGWDSAIELHPQLAGIATE